MMWGPATAIAMSEIQRHAEESISRVRAELLRFGCSDVILVRQTKNQVKLTYGEMCLVAEPSCLLSILSKVEEVGHPEDLWAILSDEIGKHYERVWLRLKILVAFLLGVLVIVFVMLI